ncbi:hypothetical protein [Pseudomonas sp. K2I15]|uniref:hypothetical protein n=1 Tax=unclassified Pseudomonas TaxID=196821 RepID=UPI000B4D8C23|nr:hypothetical protein [Pseudomonas sp. K2I15]OWP68902.1 hypothetical protein CEC48_25640 [Pseudomonas sp. K2I15]
MSLTLAIYLTIDIALTSWILWYLKYRKLEEIERYFTENIALQRNKRFWSWNKEIDRRWRVTFITMYLVAPKEMIRRGAVTKEELAAIPQPLKRWFIWSFYWGTLNVIAMFAWLIWAKVL